MNISGSKTNGNSPTGQTRRRIFTLDGSTTRLAELCTFWVFRWYRSPFWGEIPPPQKKIQFLGKVNRRFQAKRAKYWKFHIIETTASISTKFRKTIETTKWSSWVAPIASNKSKMADGRCFEKKPLNRHISATVWRILVKFGTVTHIGPLYRIVKISNFWKSKMAAADTL